MSAEVLSKLVNLLSFVALGLTILLIVRTSLEGQVRVFGLQSFVLALLSMLIALYSGSLELFGVGVALARRQRRHHSPRAQSRRGEDRHARESPRRIWEPRRRS